MGQGQLALSHQLEDIHVFSLTHDLLLYFVFPKDYRFLGDTRDRVHLIRQAQLGLQLLSDCLRLGLLLDCPLICIRGGHRGLVN
jgi:hypothetical protein